MLVYKIVATILGVILLVLIFINLFGILRETYCLPF